MLQLDNMSEYERELKKILEADENTINNISKSCNEIVKYAIQKIKNRPFIVLRAAGSFGIDLVAIRNNFSFPIEVKTSHSKIIHFNTKRLKNQAMEFREICKKCKIIIVYAFRLKGHIKGTTAWKMFTLPIDNIESSDALISGRYKLLYNRLPKLRYTKNKNYIMCWDEGMQLHKFIEYLCDVS